MRGHSCSPWTAPLTQQLAVELLLFLLQPADPLLKGLQLLSSSSLQLLRACLRPAEAASVSEAAVSGEGEAHKGQMLTSETSVRGGRADLLQTHTLRKLHRADWTLQGGPTSSPGSSGHRHLRQSWTCPWARTRLGCRGPRLSGCCPSLSR